MKIDLDKLRVGFNVLLIIGFIIWLIIIADTMGDVRVENKKIEIQNHHNICNDLDLEYLSVTKQLIGDDFVICYNNQTKETREISI